MKVMKILFIFFCLQIVSISLISKEKDLSSNIGLYVLKEYQVIGSPKIFINDTCCKTFIISWELAVPNSDIIYSQHKILAPASQYKLDMSKAVDYLKSKFDKNIINYELGLSLGVVTQAPIEPRMDFKYRALSKTEKGLRIRHDDFLQNNTFRFNKNKNGKILVSVSE